ncbi:hypothetical protein XH92_10665 [Bradyrhizobium sp. CCBAU 53421]|nr:hypothetical protein XH92_10665 [Bradyrhizobium sp. CCBAU 53421]
MDVKEAHANFEALGPGTLVVDMTLVDGSKWKGRFFVTPAVRAGLSSPVFAGAAFEADRLKGSSLVEIVSIVALGIGPNGPVSFTFSDGRDQPGRPAARIGGFEIFSDGEGVVAAAGGGTWERIA